MRKFSSLSRRRRRRRRVRGRPLSFLTPSSFFLWSVFPSIVRGLTASAMAPGSSLSLSPPPPPLIPPFPGGGEEKEQESPPFPEDSRPLNQTAPPLYAEGEGGKKEPLLIMWGSPSFLCAMLHFACSAGWKMGGWGWGGTDRPQPLPVAKIMIYYSAAEGKGCLSPSSCKHNVPVIHFLSGISSLKSIPKCVRGRRRH